MEAMKLRADQTGDRGLPMPLWLQGGLESAQAAFISALVVIAPIVAVWATSGFGNAGLDALVVYGKAARHRFIKNAAQHCGIDDRVFGDPFERLRQGGVDLV